MTQKAIRLTMQVLMLLFIANKKNHALRAWSEFNGFAS